MPDRAHFSYRLGEDVSTSRRNRTVYMTELLREALPIIQGTLIVAALNQTTVTYKELSVAIDARYHYRQLGDALDVLSRWLV
jgi:hypothetical protein